MQPLPEGAPDNIGEAFAKISASAAPSITDLQIMVLIEAAAKPGYGAMAAEATHPEIKALMLANGREELAHAHRVARAIGILTGGAPYPVPAPEDNPYLTRPFPRAPISKAMLEGLAQSEFGGDGLYQKWAQSCPNPQVAELFRQNGREETRHGERMKRAVALYRD